MSNYYTTQIKDMVQGYGFEAEAETKPETPETCARNIGTNVSRIAPRVFLKCFNNEK